jgi:Cys-rich repeat protein
MDSDRFDGLVRSFGQSRSRRQMLRGLAGIAAVGALALGEREADAGKLRNGGSPCTRGRQCKTGTCVGDPGQKVCTCSKKYPKCTSGTCQGGTCAPPVCPAGSAYYCATQTTSCPLSPSCNCATDIQGNAACAKFGTVDSFCPSVTTGSECAQNADCGAGFVCIKVPPGCFNCGTEGGTSCEPVCP